MAPKKADKTPRRSTKKTSSQPQAKSSSWLNFFRFGESYSSLILGIIVVIVTTIILVFLVKDRNVTPKNGMKQEVSSTQTSVAPSPTIVESTVFAKNIVSPTITKVVPSITPTITIKPTASLQPTKIVTTEPTKLSTNTPIITKAPEKQDIVSNGNVKTHIVAAGENLWTIAEQYYKSGYNWVDIAQANKLADPSLITTGMKLTIPNVAPKMATITTQNNSITEFGAKITGTTYTVQKGDSLWAVAVRAYGDGYKWSEIAKVNNITSPNVIFTGIVLKLPRPTPTNK